MYKPNPTCPNCKYLSCKSINGKQFLFCGCYDSHNAGKPMHLMSNCKQWEFRGDNPIKGANNEKANGCVEN